MFRKSCSVCHGIRPGETKVGSSLYGLLREGSVHSEQAVRQTIADGKGTMPAFKEKLESGQIDGLLAYLRTLYLRRENCSSQTLDLALVGLPENLYGAFPACRGAAQEVAGRGLLVGCGVPFRDPVVRL